MVNFILPDRRDLVKIMLFIGSVQILIYLFCAGMASPGAHLAIPQPDTLLYCQSARQIAEGMPFVYTPGDKPSTGCTSHLYPFVLAVPYALGAKGPALVTAGFFLNAAFYLIFLFSWAVIIFRIVEDKRAQAAACLLLALSGHAVYSALAQSDIGFFMALSAGLFAALLAGRLWLFAVLLWLSPWARPEGMMLILCYAAALMLRQRFSSARPQARQWLVAALGVLSVCGVFALNYTLTGYFQFTSVAFKTYFKSQPFPSALFYTLSDLCRMAKELFLGTPYSMPRDAYFLPVLGAALAWLAVFNRNWRGETAWQTLWWLGASLLALGSVAMSGWQNTNTDRYLAWLMPLWLVFVAEGSVFCAAYLRHKAAAWIPFATVLAYQVVAAIALGSVYFSSSISSQHGYDYALNVSPAIPAGASIGGMNCALAYAWPGHHFVHTAGLYSPDFLTSAQVMNLDMLKHRPERRFDLWFFYNMDKGAPSYDGVNMDILCGEQLAQGVDNSFLARARWDALDRARLPLTQVVTNSAGSAPLELVARLDVGYRDDEKKYAYQTGSRFHGVTYRPFGENGQIGTNNIIDVGRAIVGWDEMTLQLQHGRDLHVVMRTTDKASVTVIGARYSRQEMVFKSPLKLRLKVNDTFTGLFELPLECASNRFAEVAFKVPAGLIASGKNRIEIYGDRAVFGYWFYQ